MSRIVYIILSFALFAGSICEAGNTSSGGGDAVVCRDHLGVIISAKLFDYWEAEKLSMPAIQLGATGLNPVEKALNAVDRIAVLDPTRSRLYREQIEGFFANTNLLSGVILNSVDDIRNTFEPTPGCRIEQLAIQKDPETPAQKRFTINKDLYDALLNDDQRAGLILHEVIYWEARKIGQTDSVKTRYFNAVISAETIESMDAVQYKNLLDSIGFNQNNDTNHVSIHCIAQDYYDDNGWWEVKIQQSSQGVSRGEVWWLTDYSVPQKACEAAVRLTDTTDDTVSYQAEDDLIYLYIKDISHHEGYGKLWTSGCPMPDLDKIAMDCKLL